MKQNPRPETLGLVKPKIGFVKFDPKLLANVFNTWNKRYSEDPKAFFDSLDADGKPIEDYGECCAVYFQKLYNELD